MSELPPDPPSDAKPAKKPKADKAPKEPKAAKPPKAPKRTSPEYQAAAAAFREALAAPVVEWPERVAAALRLPEAWLVAEPERVVYNVCARRNHGSHSINDSEEKMTTFYAGDAPDVRDEGLRNWRAEVEGYQARADAKDRTLLALAEAGCDLTSSRKAEDHYPLDAYVKALPHKNDASRPELFDEARTVRVLVPFLAAERALPVPRSLVGLGHVVWCERWGVVARLLEEPLSRETLLDGVEQLLPQAPREMGEDARAALARCCEKLRTVDPEALQLSCPYQSSYRNDPPQPTLGALGLAIVNGRADVLALLTAAGADLHAPTTHRFRGALFIDSQHRPRANQQLAIWFEAGLTPLDVAIRIVETFEQVDELFGSLETEPTNNRRRVQRTAAVATRDWLEAHGAKPSGKRRPTPPMGSSSKIPSKEFRPRLKLAVEQLVHRLGGDWQAVGQALAALPDVYGPTEFMREALAAAGKRLPPIPNIDFGGAWLAESLGSWDSSVGARLDEAHLYPEEARPLFRRGEWLACSQSDVAVFDGSTGRVVRLGIRDGLVELAPDLMTFVEQDLGKIVLKTIS